MKVTPLNQFRELQILWLFPARSSDTGTAGTGIEILGSFSARPLIVLLGQQPSAAMAHRRRLGSQYSLISEKIDLFWTSAIFHSLIPWD